MSRKLTIRFVLPLAFALSSAPAFAQDAEPEPTADAQEGESEATVRARAHFKKGVDYYSEGDLTAAMVEFKRAYDIEPSFRLLYNLAQVAYEQRDYVQAERYFTAYLEQGGTQIEIERRVEVERELERLKGRVANIYVRTNIGGAQLFIDDQAIGTEPMIEPARVSAGRRTVRAELAGRAPATRVIEVVGGEPQRIELTFAAPVDVTYEEPARSDGPGAALWTGIATGVLAAGTVGMAIWTSSEQAAYDDAKARETSRTELEDLSDSTTQKALITDVLLGATVVTGVITVVLLLTDDDSDERATANGFTFGPSSVHGRF
jgi:Tfp pilus assembly protein PilF